MSTEATVSEEGGSPVVESTVTVVVDGEGKEHPVSRLGTQAYWDHLYTQELDINEANGDIGEVWFGERTQAQVVAALVKQFPDPQLRSAASVLELGCGNGALLKLMVLKGFTNLLGTDYSEKAIELARRVIVQEDPDEPFEGDTAARLSSVQFAVADVLKWIPPHPFDLVVDKGTFDAMSLNPEFGPGQLDEFKATYAAVVRSFLVDGGLFSITSCNFTRAELLEFLSPAGFVLVVDVPHPTMSFGGSSGQAQTTLIVRRSA